MTVYRLELNNARVRRLFDEVNPRPTGDPLFEDTVLVGGGQALNGNDDTTYATVVAGGGAFGYTRSSDPNVAFYRIWTDAIDVTHDIFLGDPAAVTDIRLRWTYSATDELLDDEKSTDTQVGLLAVYSHPTSEEGWAGVPGETSSESEGGRFAFFAALPATDVVTDASTSTLDLRGGQLTVPLAEQLYDLAVRLADEDMHFWINAIADDRYHLWKLSIQTMWIEVTTNVGPSVITGELGPVRSRFT